MIALARIALGGTLAAHSFELSRDAGNTILDAAAVGFQLGFTFTAAHADAAFLPGQVAPEPGQPRQQMLELGQFDLEFSFTRAGALGENIEDQGRAIENLTIENLFEVAALGGGEFIIENDGIQVTFSAMLSEL